MDNRAIGVFDSGVGGLTAVRRLHELMPHEDIIYFGDTGRVPYGTRSPETILKYTRQDVRFLRGFDIKAIIVACNTVSATALDTVAAETDVPMIGVVWPACAQALAATRVGRIGVIGTQATIRSGIYARMLTAARPDLTVYMQACPLFVPLAENGRVHRGDIIPETLAREYLTPLREAGVDTLILGCTHYPLLSEVITDVMGSSVTLIDSGAAAADSAQSMLVPAQPRKGQTRYFVSDDAAGFNALAPGFLHAPLSHPAELVDINAYWSRAVRAN